MAQDGHADTDEVSRFASFCITDAPEGIPVVRNKQRYGQSAFFAYPGGREQPGEGPLKCLYREQEQEVGIDDIEKHNPRLVRKLDRRTHEWHLYYVKYPKLPASDTLKKVGDEGEEVQIWSPQELLATLLQDEALEREERMSQLQFHPMHRRASIEAVKAIVDGRQPNFID